MARPSSRFRESAPPLREAPAATATDHAAEPLADRTHALQFLLLKAGLILLAVLWVYAPVYHGDWLWDDDQLLTANPTVQSKSLAGLAKLWIDPDGADYFPLS
jgi:hypothetical protein